MSVCQVEEDYAFKTHYCGIWVCVYCLRYTAWEDGVGMGCIYSGISSVTVLTSVVKSLSIWTGGTVSDKIC